MRCLITRRFRGFFYIVVYGITLIKKYRFSIYLKDTSSYQVCIVFSSVCQLKSVLTVFLLTFRNTLRRLRLPNSKKYCEIDCIFCVCFLSSPPPPHRFPELGNRPNGLCVAVCGRLPSPTEMTADSFSNVPGQGAAGGRPSRDEAGGRRGHAHSQSHHGRRQWQIHRHGRKPIRHGLSLRFTCGRR